MLRRGLGLALLRKLCVHVKMAGRDCGPGCARQPLTSHCAGFRGKGFWRKRPCSDWASYRGCDQGQAPDMAVRANVLLLSRALDMPAVVQQALRLDLGE